MAKKLNDGESWLMLWNPIEDPVSGEEFEWAKSEGSKISLGWRVPFGSQIKGDLFFMKCSSKGKFPGIFAMGVCEEDKEPGENGLVLTFSHFLDDESVISNEELREVAAPLLKRVGSGTVIDSAITANIKKLFEQRLGKPKTPNVTSHTEGQLREVNLTKRERNKQARAECLAHFGDEVCQVCETNFVELYGDLGRILHVHHREDLSLKDGPSKVSGKDDLIPVCPNCHAMLHFEKPAMSINKLKSVLNSSRK